MSSQILIDAREMELILDRLTAQILEKHGNGDELILVGIQRRGADLAERLAERLDKGLEKKIQWATLDINLYRDDWTLLSDSMPHIGQTSMPFNIDGKTILLVDDVLFSGRTVRAALEALLDYGRPGKVELLVFIDRGHRELPICADYAGRRIETEKNQHVDVLFKERDGRDAVCLSH